MNANTKKIKILMIKKDITNRDLALMAGVDESFISHLIRGRRKSKQVQRIVALQLNVDVEDIFPKARAA